MANTTAYWQAGAWTGSFAVPAGAYNGATRMRVLSNYSSTNPTDPCVSSTSVEIEDYNFTVTGGVTNNLLPTAYTWYDGATSLASTGPLVNTSSPSTVVATTDTKSYTASFTAKGCTKTTAPVSVTVTELPAAPTTTASTQLV